MFPTAYAPSKEEIFQKAVLKALRDIAKELKKDKARKHREIEAWKKLHSGR